MKYLRSPFLQFVFLGIAIYIAHGAFSQQKANTDATTIVISALAVEQIEAAWEKRWMRPPTPTEREGQISALVEGDVLYREALALGLDRDDPLLRRLLAQKLRRMVQDLAMGTPPTEVELKAFFDANAEKYLDPERITITQIFFDPDKRGDATLKDAETAKLKLQAAGTPDDKARKMGDAFMLQSYFPQRTQVEIAKVLGSGFAKAAFELGEGEWHGPVLSGYGVHLVYLHARTAAAPPDFALIKNRVQQDWELQRRRDFTAKYIEGLMAKYKVVVEDASKSESPDDVVVAITADGE
jgi:peptidyl-prolyl cis-trans isomerase C